MTIGLLLLLPFVLLALGFWISLSRQNRLRVTEPSCGKCYYCVRGLEGDICPECGSDLRAVGILQPGTMPPLSRGKRVFVWLCFAPLITLALFLFLQPFVVPQWLYTQQQRVIFLQAPYCNGVLTASANGKQIVFGNARHLRMSPTTRPAGMAAPEVLFVSGSNPAQSLEVRLPQRSLRYRDPSGKVVQGQFDAIMVTSWLNAQGFTDPRVADRAVDVLNALNEIGTPAGQGFTRFPADGSMRNNMNTGIAHPTIITTSTQTNELTWASGFLLFAAVFGSGLPFAWRERKGGTGKSPVSWPITGESPVPH
jgi:hypothetical protein